VTVFTAAGVVATAARAESLARAAHADMTAGTKAVMDAVRLGSSTAGTSGGGAGKVASLDELTRQVAVDQAASQTTVAKPADTTTGGGKRHEAHRGGYQRRGGRIAMSDLVITRELPSSSPDARTVTFEAAFRDGSLVTVKLLKPDAGEEEHSRFLRETQLLQRLKLDHVVRVSLAPAHSPARGPPCPCARVRV